MADITGNFVNAQSGFTVSGEPLLNFNTANYTYGLISGWLAESVPRCVILQDQVTLVSGTLVMARVYLPKGSVVKNLSFVTGGTGATTPTHSFLGLWDQNLVQLATTADAGAAAIGTFTTITYPLTTIASGASTSFITTYSGAYNIGLCVVASGMPKLYGTSSNPATNQAPGLGGTSTTGLTGPPGFPSTATAVTFVGQGTAYFGAS